MKSLSGANQPDIIETFKSTSRYLDDLLNVENLSISNGLLWFSAACFGVRISVTFHLMCVHIIFSSVSVAEWSPFGKQLLIRLTICSLCILTICYISYFPFWF